MLEARASTIATTAATLGASAIALGGLLYSAQFSFSTTRILVLAVMIGCFSIAVVLALLALSVRNYPNIPVATIRDAKASSIWTGEAFDTASSLFETYATYLGSIGTKNDRKAHYNRFAVWFEIIGVVVTLLGGLLLAIHHLS